jgi:hypothetical protein
MNDLHEKLKNIGILHQMRICLPEINCEQTYFWGAPEACSPLYVSQIAKSG